MRFPSPATAFLVQALSEPQPLTLAVSVIFRKVDVVESPPKIELLDCCGVNIPKQTSSADNCEKKLLPPLASECCAYENIEHDPTAKDKLRFVYSVSGFSSSQKAFLVINDIYGKKIYETEVPMSQTRSEVVWPLTKTDGSALNVADLPFDFFGRLYLAKIEVRDGTKAIDESGNLPVVVDDARFRNEILAGNDMGALNNQSNVAELLATRVILKVSQKVVEKTETQLVDGTDNWDDACNIQGINREIIGKLIIQLFTEGSCWKQAVTAANTDFAAAGENPVKFKSALETGFGRFVDCETTLRANAFIISGCPTARDSQSSINIVIDVGSNIGELMNFVGTTNIRVFGYDLSKKVKNHFGTKQVLERVPIEFQKSKQLAGCP